MLSEENIKKYQEIYKKQFGKEIIKEKAIEIDISMKMLAEIILE